MNKKKSHMYIIRCHSFSFFFFFHLVENFHNFCLSFFLLFYPLESFRLSGCEWNLGLHKENFIAIFLLFSANQCFLCFRLLYFFYFSGIFFADYFCFRSLNSWKFWVFLLIWCKCMTTGDFFFSVWYKMHIPSFASKHLNTPFGQVYFHILMSFFCVVLKRISIFKPNQK